MESTLSAKHPRLCDLAAMEDVPTLASVRQAFGEPALTEYINLLLIDLFDYTEQPQGVTPERIYECASLIGTSYYFLNLLELLYFFAECKLAHFGTFFGKTGPLQVSNMLSKFCFARQQSIQEDEARKHRELSASNRSTDRNALADYLDLKRRALSGDKEAQQKINELIHYRP